MIFKKSDELRRKAHSLIPGGCHTYAKGDDQYPERAPGFILNGRGSHIFDVDGNEFIEYGMGLRSVTLGHACPRIITAACRQMWQGTNFLRPSVIEVEYAEELLDQFPAADMVKFGKHGSDATSAAVKLARAYTGRDMIAIPSQHPFLSVDDWFIGSTPMSAGIPDAVRAMTLRFTYNDIDSLHSLFDKYPGNIACVVMEAAKEVDPSDHFLQKVIDLCHNGGALFILDEMITGFRWDLGGAQRYYNIKPDMSTFGKAMANGFSVSALMGKKEFMIAGGTNHKKERVFLMSTTHGAETHSLAAARETLKVYLENDIIGEMWQKGRYLREGIQKTIDELNLGGNFRISGKDCCLVYATLDENQERSQPFRTLFLQETIKQGLLMPSLIVSFAHSQEDLDITVNGVSEALNIYKKALEEGIGKYLTGRSVSPVFRPFGSQAYKPEP